MTRSAILILLAGAAAFAQKPSNPALLVPQEAPAMALTHVTPGVTGTPDDFGLPGGLIFHKGHLWVLNRGKRPVSEFDADGKYIRSFGEGLFGNRPHNLRIDTDDNIWVADGSTHIVVKMDIQGKVLMTLGTKGKAGAWDDAAGTQLFNTPNDIAFGDNGTFFIVQGHQPGTFGGGGDPRVFKFDKTGKLIKSWGGKGTEPGKFEVAHSVTLYKGELWVTDRENSRIQIFDQDGNYKRELKYAGLPCAIDVQKDAIWMVNGFTGQILKLDLDGKVLAVAGKAGDQPGEFGEAHYVAVSPKGDIYVADVVKGVQKFVPR